MPIFASSRSSSFLKIKLPHLLLIFLILTYTAYFSWYTINRHNTLNSYAADLSLIDQPMWNTVLGSGYFMEQTWGSRQQPRLAEHFEPILIPLAALFFIWDDVRILLIAQSLALALGALPVFWIAKYRFALTSRASPASYAPTWVALTFATVYLLYPHLQAANIADLHADPFVVTPLLLAFWYASQRRWRWMWLWAVVAMLTKENLPTLTAMLGLFLLLNGERARYFSRHRDKTVMLQGLSLILISLAWFLIATFAIVAPLARHYYGSDGPIYLANRFEGGLAALPMLLQDPARWRYLWGLFAAAGFLPLLAPELLLLGLPVLAANLLSNYPGQYSGEQHYSAPVVVAFILAAIYGTSSLFKRLSLYESNKGRLEAITAALCLWLLSWSLGYHSLHGWTPLSSRTEAYAMGPPAAQLPQFISQIPAEAVVSSSPAIHPHLAHRRVNYLFPIVEDAQYLLVDVTDISGVHPNDVYAQLRRMLATDWQLMQAANGLILAKKMGQPSNASTSAPAVAASFSLPAPFFDFVRASTAPRYPAGLSFGDQRLRLLGYDVLDDPDDGVIFRFYWQAATKLTEELKLWPLIYNDMGQLLNDPGQVPMIATVWYPPSAWSDQEVIVTETLPQLLPATFHLGLAAGPEQSFYDPGQRYPVQTGPADKAQLYPGHWVQLASFKRQGPWLVHLPPMPTFKDLKPLQAQFGPFIQLTGFWLDSDSAYRAGTELPLLLRWQAVQSPPTDFTVFIHLLAPDGSLAAQRDARPTWLVPQLTSQWPLERPLLDSHQLHLPDDLPPGAYTLTLGLYHVQTLERLPLADGRDALSVGSVRIR